MALGGGHVQSECGQASGVRGGGGFPVSAAQDGVGIAEGGAGRGRMCTPCLEVNPSTRQVWLLSLQLQAAALGLSSHDAMGPGQGSGPQRRPPLLWLIRLVLNMGDSREFYFLSALIYFNLRPHLNCTQEHHNPCAGDPTKPMDGWPPTRAPPRACLPAPGREREPQPHPQKE